MKIYPANHKIISKEKKNIADIPLAYLEMKEENTIKCRYEYNVNIYQPEKIKFPVSVYQKFDTNKLYFFSSDTEERKDVELKRVGNHYIYSPAIKFFSPTVFTYSIILKRNESYSSDINYNISLGIIQDTIQDTNFINNMTEVFLEGAKRKICPENISINKGSNNPNTFSTGVFSDNDFLFCSSSDGTGSFKLGQAEYSIYDLLNQNCNVWLTVNSFGDLLKKTEEEKEVTCVLKENSLYEKEEYTLKDYPYYFDLSYVHKFYPPEVFEYINIFKGACPILILHKKNAGYIIISEQSFLSNMIQNANLIYEILFQIYSKSYKRTEEKQTWITDLPVQYRINLNMSYKKNHPDINLLSILKENNINIFENYEISQIVTNNKNISYIGIDANFNLFFRKTNKTDPVIPGDCTTIYSLEETILIYPLRENVISLIEDSMKNLITYKLIGEHHFLSVSKFKSSLLQLDFPETIFEIKDIGTSYVLCAKFGKVYLLTQKEYKEQHNINYIKLADIYIKKNTELNSYDLRSLGGGESEFIENYEMIDTGNLLGRPYRKGSGVIIELPSSYKKYEDIIKEQINLNISSSEEPFIIYRGEQDNHE